MGKGALGLLSAYWPEMTARHAHVPLERAPQFTVHRSAKSDPDRAALVTPDRSVSFAELSGLVRAAGAGIAERAGDGGRVAVLVDDPLAQAACAFGAWEADRLLFVASGPVPPGPLADFAPDLVVGAAGVEGTPGWAGHPDRVDYLAGSFAAADARYAGATPALRDVRAGVGAILGIEGPFSPARRRRLARRLGTPVLTLYGRNDLGPVLGSHPT